ncbi:MAG: metal-dependent transcriptional regulator [Anaerolineales bacterium]
MASPTPTVEDYLGAIYTLSRDQEPVIGRKLADWMEVSPPTVTATIQRMTRDGWVLMHDDKTIHLTDAGLELAAAVVRRHMLTELLLARVLDVPWARVHEEADRLEHAMSADIAARVAELVDNPDLCPHGNPLPGHEQEAELFVPLLACPVGGPYVLARVHEEVERNSELMAYLEEHAVVPGSEIRVVAVLPFNETITIETAKGQVVLGMAVSRYLWVCPVNNHTEAEGGAGRSGAERGDEG